MSCRFFKANLVNSGELYFLIFDMRNLIHHYLYTLLFESKKNMCHKKRIYQQVKVLRSSIVLLAAMIILFSGCAGSIGVKPVELDKRFKDMDRSALTSNSMSEETLLFLRQRDMVETWKNDPISTLIRLDTEFREQPDRRKLFALSELSLMQAKQAPKLSDEALKLYLSCAYYAYTYLFDEKIGEIPNPYHPFSRLACEFYNRALSGYLLYHRDGPARYKKDNRFSMLTGRVAVAEGKKELQWDAEDYDAFYITYEFEPKGLENHIRTYGIGVPLIAVRKPKLNEEDKKKNPFLPAIQQTYTATMLLRFVSVEKDAAGDILHRAELDLYDPTETNEILIGNRPVPLESDFTTPLAFLIQQNPIPSGITGLFRVESWNDLQGLHMLQPYYPDKIPVVFVHGLMSSPETWLPMFNNLLADEKIRENYQFWFFMYPTGNPIAYSASILRESLKEARQIFDPKGKNPAFNQMVLVGHSMGGLLSKLMILNGTEEEWEKYSGIPLSELKLTPKQRNLIEQVFVFDPLPFISRVIFIATPHRGSEWADRRIGRLAAWLVKLPVTLISNTFTVMSAMAQDEQARMKLKLDSMMLTGIDGLRPESPFIRITNEIPFPENIPYHSIIGNNEAADTPGGTDGIVPYESSHLDGAVSEKIVLSGHSAHNHPLAIQEVRLILRCSVSSCPMAGYP